MADLSVIIVTWNSGEEITPCVKSVIKAAGNLSTELIIIDNNSDDDSFEQANKISFPKLQTYRNPSNLGYTKAVNRGISFAGGNYILLLNPDTVLDVNTIEKLYSFLGSNPEYGACAPLLLNEDGSIQHSVRSFPGYMAMFFEFSLLAYIFPKSKFFNRWKMGYFGYANSADVEQPMAAALMVRKDALEKTGNMDERFEMFFNDVDLCRSIYNCGLKIRFLADAKVIHKHGASVKKDRARMIRIWNRDCVKYFEKHFGGGALLAWLKLSLALSGFIRIMLLKLTGK